MESITGDEFNDLFERHKRSVKALLKRLVMFYIGMVSCGIIDVIMSVQWSNAAWFMPLLIAELMIVFITVFKLQKERDNINKQSVLLDELIKYLD
jgi:hypothetical protein